MSTDNATSVASLIIRFPTAPMSVKHFGWMNGMHHERTLEHTHRHRRIFPARFSCFSMGFRGVWWKGFLPFRPDLPNESDRHTTFSLHTFFSWIHSFLRGRAFVGVYERGGLHIARLGTFRKSKINRVCAKCGVVWQNVVTSNCDY